MSEFSIAPAAGTLVSDRDLEDLLKSVYVGGGFTEASVGDILFRAGEVRARGELLVAQDDRGNLIGTVITVLPGSPACRIAKTGEAELHLLCVRTSRQRHGVGIALVEAAIAAARGAGATRMILWTQPSMEAARRLYVKLGFERIPDLDFSRGERTFRVFARSI
jgi:GNAT superfamily N-acetyltransferase